MQAYLVEHYRPGLVLCLLEAASEELVREAYARAGIPFERISIAIDQGGRT